MNVYCLTKSFGALQFFCSLTLARLFAIEPKFVMPAVAPTTFLLYSLIEVGLFAVLLLLRGWGFREAYSVVGAAAHVHSSCFGPEGVPMARNVNVVVVSG